ncbi:MAG: squalene/phytoene synthase family protein [Magnetococcales bacterium]|nr:squalene/phytoene synthase family protein [Magnetococcales bacterium]
MTPFSVCQDIAQKNGSPLFLVSRLLGEKKRRLFITAYAAMRIIDDLVDETFQAGDPSQRAANRPLILARIAQWRAQAIAANRRAFLPAPDAFAPPVFEALQETIGASDLGEWPWNALAEAMIRDVEEQEILTWTDFLDYCEGATVSPATTFAYILACEVRDHRYVLAHPPTFCRDHVRDMAVFCYLIHIVRDLAKDARKPPQLITIPRQMLAASGLHREGLALALEHNKTALIPLIRALLAQARERLAPGLETIHRLPLRPLERMILNRLLKKYIDLHAQLEADPTRFL